MIARAIDSVFFQRLQISHRLLRERGVSVTTADIANQVGVSRQVVGKVLLGGAANVRVSAATERRIREVAARMGYMPNVAAKAIATGKFNAIGIVQAFDPHNSSSFGGILERGIHEALTEHDMHVIMGPLRDDRLVNDNYVPTILARWSVDGLLIDISTKIPARLVELVERHRVPSIWIHSKRPADCVYPDEIYAYRAATRHLLELGHRKVVYFGPGWSDSHYSVTDRRMGYEQAMTEAGLEPQSLLFTASERRLELMQLILKGPDRPTAVLCYSDTDAGHLYVAGLKAGVDVPRDLSLMASSAFRTNATGLNFTLMEIPAAEMGRTAVRMLLTKIKDPGTALPPMVLHAQLIPGQSTAPPAR